MWTIKTKTVFPISLPLICNSNGITLKHVNTKFYEYADAGVKTIISAATFTFTIDSAVYNTYNTVDIGLRS